MKLSQKETGKWKNIVSQNIASYRGKDYYTSKPADEEIAYYEKTLKKLAKKNDQVLILGATAALRDICLELDCYVTSVDYNAKIINRMNSYMKHKNYPKDRVIKANWLNMPLKDNYYDFIIGDASLNNIDWKDYPKMIKILSRLLKKGGYFIHREVVYRPELKPRGIKDIVDEFRRTKRWRDLKYNIRLHSSLAWSKEWYDRKTYKSKWKPFFDYLVNLYKQGILTKHELDLIHAEAHALVSVFPPIKKFESLLKKHFKIIKRESCKPYTHTLSMPIYTARVIKQ